MKLNSLLRLSMLLLVGAAAMAQSKAPPSPYRIAGTIVSGIDGAPIARAHLTVTPVPRDSSGARQFPSPLGTFDADEHGHFSFSVPSAGMWRVVGSARGYVTQAYDEHQSFSTGVVLTAASPSIDLRFQLWPESVISGTVVDEAGEAVRNARVTLQQLPPAQPDQGHPPARTRASTTTDDRGVYEFDGLAPGDYRLRVQAQPWYAMAAQRGFNTASSAPVDPSLDVTYPVTWYPGSSDPSQAEILTLHPGDTRQADFQLTPIPAIHLHIVPETQPGENGHHLPVYPVIERVSPEGNDFVPLAVHMEPQGVVDVGGLAPGRYEVRMQGQGEGLRPALVDVTEGSTQTLDMNAAASMASVSIQMDGVPADEARSVNVSLIDPETGQNVTRGNSGGFVFTNGYLRQRRERPASQTISVPPGRYEVVLNGRPDLYLTGITAQSAQATGRLVTVPSGNSTLTLHIASGRATLTGYAMMQGKPSVGALVLLVPATLGEPTGLTIIRRDQTNTDGSFDLNDVLPGQYILLAIDHGWQVNWQDPSTLRGYMMHGTPIDLTTIRSMKETIEAQAP
jgi:hypothetical protein